MVFVFIGMILLCLLPFGLVKLWDYKHSKNWGYANTSSGSSEWHDLPASEVFGDSNALEETRKKWHSKPLTF